MNNGYFLQELDSILSDFTLLQSRAKFEDLSDILHDKVENLTALISIAKATIHRITLINSEYYKDIIKSTEAREHYGTQLRLIIGTVRALIK